MINKRDIRFIPLYIVSSILLYINDSYRILGWMVGVSVTLGILSHILRRVFWPYINLREYVEKAKETPLAASLVVCAVIFFLTESFTAMLALFK